MNKTLVEGQFGHGGKPQLRALHTFKRYFKPKLGMSPQPFDWNTGYSSLDKIGNIPIKNQFSSFSCGGQAGSYGMAIGLALLTGKYEELSAKSIYSPIFYSGGGTTSGSIQNIFKKDGALLESTLPSYMANGSTNEQFMEDTSWRTTASIQDALTRSGWKVVSVSRNQESFAEACRDYGFIIVQLNGKNNGTWLSKNPKPPVGGNDWSHFMCFFGADTKQGLPANYALQSWGTAVGIGGIQYFTKDYFDSNAILDAFTAIPPQPKAPQSIINDANNASLTPIEMTWVAQCLVWISMSIKRIFG